MVVPSIYHGSTPNILWSYPKYIMVLPQVCYGGTRKLYTIYGGTPSSTILKYLVTQFLDSLQYKVMVYLVNYVKQNRLQD